MMDQVIECHGAKRRTSWRLENFLLLIDQAPRLPQLVVCGAHDRFACRADVLVEQLQHFGSIIHYRRLVFAFIKVDTVRQDDRGAPSKLLRNAREKTSPGAELRGKDADPAPVGQPDQRRRLRTRSVAGGGDDRDWRIDRVIDQLQRR